MQSLGKNFGGAGSCGAEAQLLCQHLEGEIRSQGDRDKPMGRKADVHGFYGQSNLRHGLEACLLTQNCPLGVCAYGLAHSRSHGGSLGPALTVGDLFLLFPCVCFPGWVIGREFSTADSGRPKPTCPLGPT